MVNQIPDRSLAAAKQFKDVATMGLGEYIKGDQRGHDPSITI
jgi:hypothetical protein